MGMSQSEAGKFGRAKLAEYRERRSRGFCGRLADGQEHNPGTVLKCVECRQNLREAGKCDKCGQVIGTNADCKKCAKNRQA